MSISFDSYPQRSDLIAEISDTTSPEGGYNGGWHDSSGIDTIRIAIYDMPGTPQVTLQEGQWSQTTTDGNPQIVSDRAIPFVDGSAFIDMKLAGRFFNIAISGALPSIGVVYTIRKVN